VSAGALKEQLEDQKGVELEDLPRGTRLEGMRGDRQGWYTYI